MTEEVNEKPKKNNRTTIKVHPEFLEVLDKLEEKIKKLTYGGVSKITRSDLTRILARKIKENKGFL